VAGQNADHAWRFTLSNEAGRTLRSWRVISENDLGAQVGTPALVGGDPVVVLEVGQETKTEFLYEYEVLRLARAGGAKPRFALATDTRAVWGDTPITGVRVGPDGHLYRMQSSRTAGVSIGRYRLDAAQPKPPAPKPPAPTPADPKGQPIDDGGLTAPSVTVPPAQPAATPAATQSAVRPWLPWLAGVAASTLAGLPIWLVYRRRHPAGLGPHGGSGTPS
jgi:hypothetical protein